MTELSELYRQAAQANIDILRYPLKQTGSMSLMTPAGDCYVGMDEAVLDGSVSERVHLSHELGHCLTGSFYNIYSPADTRLRHEHKADKWAIRRLIPVDALDDAIAAGHTDLWDLADYFGVTEDFLRKALCLYVHGNLATELYF